MVKRGRLKNGDVFIEYDPANPPPLTAKQKAELDAQANIRDEDIDFSDIPELTEEFWKNAVMGKHYRPMKQQITLRLDSDVLAWFKAEADGERGYQTNINRVLREHMIRQRKAPQTDR